MRPGPVFSLLAAMVVLAAACGGGAGTNRATEGAPAPSTGAASPDATDPETATGSSPTGGGATPSPCPSGQQRVVPGGSCLEPDIQPESEPAPAPEPEPEPEPEPDPQTFTVSVVDFAFEGGDLDLDVGDTVVFRHDGDVSHTATNRGGEFDSGNLRPGDTYSVTFTNPGEFSYVCLYHSQMNGTITVSG